MKGVALMQTLKQEAVEAISELHDSTNIEEVMYHLYVIDKVKNGIDSVERSEIVSVGQLRNEISSW